MPDRECVDPAEFLSTVQSLGLKAVIIAWQEEYGQDLTAPGVVYERLAHFCLLAYDKTSGTIVRCLQHGDRAARDSIAGQLSAAGLQVEQRTRNEVGFRT